MTTILLHLNRFALPLFGAIIVLVCGLWLALRHRTHRLPEAGLLNAINHDKRKLTRYENAIGRSKHCDVVLNYPSVSRFHAVMARRKHGWVIDTGSRGGVKVSGHEIKRYSKITHGQTITFGICEFVFYDVEEEARGEKF